MIIEKMVQDTTCPRDANYLTLNVGVQDDARRVLNAGIWLCKHYLYELSIDQEPFVQHCVQQCVIAWSKYAGSVVVVEANCSYMTLTKLVKT